MILSLSRRFNELSNIITSETILQAFFELTDNSRALGVQDFGSFLYS